MTPRLTAAQAGSKRYQAKPCKVCACTTRYTSSGCCTACNDRRSKEFAAKVRDAMRGAK